MQNERMSSLEALIAAGFDLFPIRPRDKRPRDKGWRTIQYDPPQLRAWVAAGGNVGIRLRATDLVIDWDPRNDLMGDTLERFAVDAGLDLSICPTVATPSGGLHVFVTIPADALVRAKLKKQYPGLDFKTDGGYVLGIGSVHPNHPGGPLYRLDGDGVMAAGPPLPAAGLEIIRVRERTQVAAAAGGDDMSLEYLAQLVSHLDLDAYGDWIEVGMAINKVTGGSDDGLAVWTEASTRSARPDTEEACRVHWESFDPTRPGGVGGGTIRHRVEEAIGHVPVDPAVKDLFDPPPPPEEAPFKWDASRGKRTKTLKNAIFGLRTLRLDLAKDLWWDQIEIRGDLAAIREQYPSFPDVWTDAAMDAVREILVNRSPSTPTSKDDIHDAANALADQHAFNPLADWLRGLEWDGVERLGTWLVRFAGAPDSEYTRAVGSKILMAAVARAFKPGTKFDCMLVLEGPQGVGKSRLVAAIGGEYLSTGLSTQDLRSKDAVDAIRTSWVIEVDEMEVLRRTDIGILKSFLSRGSDKVRLAYRRNAEEFYRRCILIGTTNESEYLQDPTGARRFWPVKTQAVTPEGWLDVGGFVAERDQIFAEAVAAWEACPDSQALTLAGEAQEQSRAAQDERYEEDAWQSKIERSLAPPDQGGEKALWADVLHLSDILYLALHITYADQNNSALKRGAGVMKRLGWKREMGRVAGKAQRLWRRP